MHVQVALRIALENIKVARELAWQWNADEVSPSRVASPQIFFFLCLSLSFSLEFPANTWAHCQEHVVSFSLFNPPPCHHYQQAHYQGLTADSKQHPPTSILKSWCCMHTQIHTSCTYNCLHVMWSQILFRDDTAELDMILGSGGVGCVWHHVNLAKLTSYSVWSL